MKEDVTLNIEIHIPINEKIFIQTTFSLRSFSALSTEPKLLAPGI
jgi:hypothetical protein